MPVKLRLFGVPSLSVDGRPVAATCSRKVLELLGFVATGADARRTRDETAAALWPDATPATARTALRRHLHYLATALPAAMPAVVRDRAWLSVGKAMRVDVLELGNGRREKLLDGELGEFLETYDAEWITPVRARLREEICAALESSIRDRRACGRIAEALQCARRLDRMDPLNESNARTIMELLADLGDSGGALRYYDAFESRMARAFGAAPNPETISLSSRLREPSRAKLVGFPNEITSLVGRHREVEELTEALRLHALVTCVGPPGIGKTRAAVRAAAARAAAGGTPAFFVNVADCIDEPSIVDALEAVTRRDFSSVGPDPSSLEQFSGRSFIVVFDNCERVANHVAAVATRLCSVAAEARVLATSRVPLHVNGEALHEIGPLSIAAGVELFRERAQLVRRAVSATSASENYIRALCRQAGGIPLAIELAAARLRTATLRHLASAASRQPPALEASFAMSVELLDQPARTLFRRLAAFRGSFTVETAAALAADDVDDVPERLATLVDYSLVTPPPAAVEGARYAMLQPLREYAWTLVARLDETRALRERHARLFADRYAAISDDLNGHRAEAFGEELDAERENVASALEVLVVEGLDVSAGALLCLAMQYHWFVSGRVVEGALWVDRILQRLERDAPLRDRLLFMRALMARQQNDYRKAIDLYREIIDVRRNAGARDDVAKALVHLSGCLSAHGDVEAARARALEARAYFEQHPDDYFLGYTASALALAALRGGNAETAETEFRVALERFRGGGYEIDVAATLCNLGACALARGNAEAAEELSREAVARAERSNAPFIVAASHVTLAVLACVAGDARSACRLGRPALRIATDTNDHERVAELLEIGLRVAVLARSYDAAARLYGAADAMRAACGAKRMPFDQTALEAAALPARHALGDKRYAALRLSGEGLPYAGALALLRPLLEEPSEAATTP